MALSPYQSMPMAVEQSVDGSIAVAELANSAVVAADPRMMLKMRGALWRAQAISALAPSAAEMAESISDTTKFRVTQTRGRVRTRFRIAATSRGAYPVAIVGEIDCDPI
ncbi:MAG: hypothetical protein ABIG71_03365 [Candidatus Uhrbacteria bacterium]